MNADKITLRPCPACQKPAQWEGNRYRPFCSRRCKLSDLDGWMSGRYRIPSRPLDPEEIKNANPDKAGPDEAGPDEVGPDELED